MKKNTKDFDKAGTHQPGLRWKHNPINMEANIKQTVVYVMPKRNDELAFVVITEVRQWDSMFQI